MKKDAKYYGEMNFSSSVAAARMARIVRMIEEAPHGMTAVQVAERERVCERSLRTYLTHMHNDLHTIHVGGWVRLAGRKVDKVYMLGDKPDVPRPSVKSSDDFFVHQNPMHVLRDHVSREYVPIKDDDNELLPVRRKATNIKPHSDPLVDIFFGRAVA